MATFMGKFKLNSSFIRRNRLLYEVKYYSTAAAAVEDKLPRYRTLENDPTRHTYNHVGKFYTIDESLKKKLYFNGGIPKPLNLQMKTFRENCALVRETSLEVISYIKNLNFSQPAVRFIIYGRTGTGKSTAIMHLVHYGYLKKYLLLHMPWVPQWTLHPKESVASQFNEKMIDLPVESTLWLQHFALQNRELLEELDLRATQKYTWSSREVTEKGDPLMSIVDHGIQRTVHASDCAAVLLKEIKLQSQSNKFKAMVLADGVNAFFNRTNVKRPDETLVPAQEVTICKAFLKMLNNDWNNAVIITTADILPYNRKHKPGDPYTPRVLLGKEGFELMDPFIPIETKNYSEKEVESVLDYFIERKWIQSEKARSEVGRKQLKFLSGYNPEELMKLCDPL